MLDSIPLLKGKCVFKKKRKPPALRVVLRYGFMLLPEGIHSGIAAVFMDSNRHAFYFCLVNPSPNPEPGVEDEFEQKTTVSSLEDKTESAVGVCNGADSCAFQSL